MKIKVEKFVILGFILASPLAVAQDMHPMMTSKYWTSIGAYFASRDFDASANGMIGVIQPEIDFESTLNLDDAPQLLMVEFGWQFGDTWGLAMQHFRSERDDSKTLEKTFRWQDLTFNAGINVQAETEVLVTRLFFARRFWDGGPHSVRVGAGFHWLEIGASIAGQATLNDSSTEFRTSVVLAKAPMPNLGVWYRYSPSNRLLLTVRADWLSASIDDFSGSIWNAAAGANYQITKHIGLGLNYQYFEINASARSSNWRGEVRTRFTGPHIYISGYW